MWVMGRCRTRWGERESAWPDRFTASTSWWPRRCIVNHFTHSRRLLFSPSPFPGSYHPRACFSHLLWCCLIRSGCQGRTRGQWLCPLFIKAVDLTQSAAPSIIASCGNKKAIHSQKCRSREPKATICTGWHSELHARSHTAWRSKTTWQLEKHPTV